MLPPATTLSSSSSYASSPRPAYQPPASLLSSPSPPCKALPPLLSALIAATPGIAVASTRCRGPPTQPSCSGRRRVIASDRSTHSRTTTSEQLQKVAPSSTPLFFIAIVPKPFFPVAKPSFTVALISSSSSLPTSRCHLLSQPQLPPSTAPAPCFLYHCSHHNLLLGRALLYHQGTLALSSSLTAVVAPKHRRDCCPSYHCRRSPLFLPSAPHDVAASSLAAATLTTEVVSYRALTDAPPCCHCCTSLLPLLPPPSPTLPLLPPPSPTSFSIYW
ncbi:hypothetical protein B296_00006703 [Ensete ventricosum]|uniref:Uncharacterized protein n=1 Tax=Ensete ventricosum TaxID=4639 RepID=A0A426Z312_ENSVE|nr:hypothetical protein B296_00006703 [Ensete ventricosum]